MNKNNKKRKIAIITGSRGEYGYIRPIIKEINKRENLDYGLIVTNMHVLDAFGLSINEMKKDNLKIFATVNNTFDGYTHLSMVKSLAVFNLQLPEILEQMGADIVLIFGDRGEQLVGAIVGAYIYKIVAHIQAGEVSGNIDGVTRHAITKFSHIHFAANKDAAERVKKLGEEEFRIHNVGAPQIDELTEGFITPKEEIHKKFSLNKDKPAMMFVYHSVTEELNGLEKQLNEILSAINHFDYQTIVILNNSDAGSRIIRKKIMEHKKPSTKIYKNLTRQDYAGLLNTTDVIVGNSSSGILEAPTFKLPAVNIGNRQRGRMQGINVINAGYNRQEIIKAIKQAVSSEFREKMKDCVNPYGDGKSAKRIVEILENVKIDDKLLIKRITY